MAARAGLSPASIYRRFADKDALSLALDRRFNDQIRRDHLPRFRDIARSGGPLEELVPRLITGHLRHLSAGAPCVVSRGPADLRDGGAPPPGGAAR